MSTSSARRTKERGGGGEKIAAGKVTPISGKSTSTGKENPRPISRVRAATQKPNLKPMARIDKSAATAVVAEETRIRRSTSSVPRGRSSSPSEFTRVLSDLRKNSNSRISAGPIQRRVSRSGSSEGMGEKCDLGKRVLKDKEKNREILDGSEGNFSRKNDRVEIEAVKNGGNERKERSLGSISVKRSDLAKRVSSDLDENYSESEKVKIRAVDGSNEKKERNLSSISVKRYSDIDKSNLELGAKIKASEEVKLRSSGVGFEMGLSLRESKIANKVITLPSGNKYQSRLHEKLAFLEGKVKRIAGDIKRTKEMLDMNNPDASKMILSDIQEKISGIEKAMVHVVGNDEVTKMGSIKRVENEDNEVEKGVDDSRSSVKGLNVEELEARLFPHHKLNRDRTLSKTSLNVDDKVSCLDYNAITLESIEVQEVDNAVEISTGESSLNVLNGKSSIDALLMANENLNEFDDQENVPEMVFDDKIEEICTYQLNGIGSKISTGGWFVSEGESVLLAHDDGSCSFYDIANCEEKAEYMPPTEISANTWRDCWIIRAPSADGCSGKYVVAASAGNSIDSGFCSWDFYTKDIRAFHFEDDQTSHVRTAFAPLSNNALYIRNAQQWWYKPCGPLIISTGSYRKTVSIYDIRDGDEIMKWDLQRPVLAMDYASPLHWKNRGKIVIAECDGISLWDVNSLNSQALLSVSSSGRKISALHVNNSDAEMGGGVRQRISSSESEGNDGVFCTTDSINVLDFRNPSGIGLKIPKIGVNVNSSYSRGDSIYIGCTNLTSTGKKHSVSQIQQFSLRQNRLLTTYTLPESNSHQSFTELTQVWGNSSYVMGICGLGLYVFDSLKNDEKMLDFGKTENGMEIIGPDDMCCPSFDYLSSRVLVISRDRPACWRYLL